MAKSRQNKYDPMKVQKGAARRAYFASGGTLAGWRGNARKFRDQRKERDKNACRGTVKEYGK